MRINGRKKEPSLKVGHYEPRGKWHDAGRMTRAIADRKEEGTIYRAPTKRWRMNGAGETDV